MVTISSDFIKEDFVLGKASIFTLPEIRYRDSGLEIKIVMDQFTILMVIFTKDQFIKGIEVVLASTFTEMGIYTRDIGLITRKVDSAK
jgi:hypothetical protein